MKRFLTAIMALLYMGTSMGATLHMHYCMGKLAGWDLSFSKPNDCSKCGMEKAVLKGKSCCNDEQKTFKNSSDQKASETSFQAISLLAGTIPGNLIEVPAVNFVSITEANPVSNAPPQCNSIAIYIRNCVFRI